VRPITLYVFVASCFVTLVIGHLLRAGFGFYLFIGFVNIIFSEVIARQIERRWLWARLVAIEKEIERREKLDDPDRGTGQDGEDDAR